MTGNILEKREDLIIIPESTKSKTKIQNVQPKKIEIKKKLVPKKKRTPTVAPVVKMVESYTVQQFFDQQADITNGQLLAMNPKFFLNVIVRPVTKLLTS